MALKKPLKSTISGFALGMVTGIGGFFYLLPGDMPDDSHRRHGGTVTHLRQKTHLCTPFRHAVNARSMKQIAFSESSGNINAYNARTGVRGLFQFKPDTFLEQLYKHGAAQGYGHLSRHIVHTPIRNEAGVAVRDHYSVPDPAMKKKILNARSDPQLSYALAEAYICAGLKQIGGNDPAFARSVTKTFAYKVLHFGPGGAKQSMGLLKNNPQAPFTLAVGDAVCANNPRICRDANGKIRSVQSVYNLLEKRLKDAPIERVAFNFDKP
jgi:hypothetical protein